MDPKVQQDKNNNIAVKQKVEQKGNNEGIVVHAMRIVVKLGIIFALYLTNNPNALFLTLYLFLSEILDQISLYVTKFKPDLKKWVGLFYALNSVAVISVVNYFAGWSLTDFYLVYLVHISSSTLAYGFRNGLFSFILSIFSYSILLYLNHAPYLDYLRLPLISILVLRLLLSQLKYEKIDKTLNTFLGVEKSKKDFIALASHNLRTPVAAIYGYIDILLRGDAGNINEQQESFIKKIRINNQELEKLTEQLLEISILEVNKEVNLIRQQSQIEVLIEDIVTKYEQIAKDKGLTFTFQKQNGLLPLVNIDVEKIRSVISNMIDNAIKYTEKGSVTIAAFLKEDNVIISVKDTGIGIAKEELPKVFTKFYRSGNVLIYNQTGVGLGLYLGKQIVELHGGKIMVDSIEGLGSTFSLSLPITKEEILQ